MIDTIALELPVTKKNILRPRVFIPSAEVLFCGKVRSVYKFPSSRDKNYGLYVPSLTIYKFGYHAILRVEFSAPKLIFGNNFQECYNHDFPKVLKALHQCLQDMSIDIPKSDLENAKVTKVHYSRNIELIHCTSNLIINTIEKMDISKRLDTGQTDFRNEGHAIRFHTSSYEVSFYDKMKDLQQSKISEKRSIESDYYIQKNIFDDATRPEILRMEVRLNKYRVIKGLFSKLGIECDITFKGIFDSNISRTILIYYWEAYIDSSMDIVILAEESPLVILNKLKSLGITTVKSEKYLGALSIIKEHGIRCLKSYDKLWYRLFKDLNDLNINDDNYLKTCFKKIKDVINSS